jgi:hypothetical protein
MAFAALALAAAPVWASTASLQDNPPVPAVIQQMARDIAGELAENCPLAPANDTAAYNDCRKALYGESKLRSNLPPVLLWGRQSKKPGATLRTTNLTQFAPEVWTHLYAALFMFNGKHTVQWVPEEKKFLIRLEAAFRNRLSPGQFPYPFWHEEDKWVMYEKANAFMLWVDPNSARIQAAQFTDRAPNPMLQPVQPVQHAFEGTWLWTDDRGNTQPAVTVFDGLYRPENPYVKAMDRQYRELALQMRESQCTSCHVPNNPDKMSRLVLLSTPAHAAGEIERLIKAVKEDRMPMDDFRVSYALSPENKKWLLESAEAFRTTVVAARAWEQQAARSEAAEKTAASKKRKPAAMAWQPVSSTSTNPAEVSK